MIQIYIKTSKIVTIMNKVIVINHVLGTRQILYNDDYLMEWNSFFDTINLFHLYHKKYIILDKIPFKVFDGGNCIHLNTDNSKYNKPVNVINGKLIKGKVEFNMRNYVLITKYQHSLFSEIPNEEKGFDLMAYL